MIEQDKTNVLTSQTAWLMRRSCEAEVGRRSGPPSLTSSLRVIFTHHTVFAPMREREAVLLSGRRHRANRYAVYDNDLIPPLAIGIVSRLTQVRRQHEFGQSLQTLTISANQ